MEHPSSCAAVAIPPLPGSTMWHQSGKMSTHESIDFKWMADTNVPLGDSSGAAEPHQMQRRGASFSRSIFRQHRLMLITLVHRLIISLRVKNQCGLGPHGFTRWNIRPREGRDQWPHRRQVHDPITPERQPSIHHSQQHALRVHNDPPSHH